MDMNVTLLIPITLKAPPIPFTEAAGSKSTSDVSSNETMVMTLPIPAAEYSE